MAQARRNPLGGFKLTKDRPPREQLLEELEGAYRTVAAKGTSEELQAYGRWLVAAAQAAADAAKEGGFMGIGAVRVSEGEQTMLELISAMVTGDDPANDDRGGESPVTSG